MQSKELLNRYLWSNFGRLHLPGHFSPHFKQGAPAPASWPSLAFNRFSRFASNSFNQFGVSGTSTSLLIFVKQIHSKQLAEKKIFCRDWKVYLFYINKWLSITHLLLIDDVIVGTSVACAFYNSLQAYHIAHILIDNDVS